jgi:rare lipoprotein A
MSLADPGTIRRAWPLVVLVMVAGCASTRTTVPSAPRDVASIPEAVPRAEPRSTRGNPPFYDVFGKRYFVLASQEGYAERGVASWYGPGFHQATTSNGERYDMYAMTAAHKTLPLPSYVRVTNLRNGRSVVVRVNDRGPFKDGRIIDLSYTAALKLDMVKEGTTFVEVRALSSSPEAEMAVAGETTLDPGPAPTASPSSESPEPALGALFVQAGAFSSQENAARLVEQLRSQGLLDSFVRQDQLNGQTWYRVRVGPIPSVPEFDRVLGQLKSLGLADARLAAD